ncbi:hypothetical protein SAMN04488002_3169 [Litoreibacter janthinus]|uniref:Uncharacterized protein n=2 Tax=Litoreibacter janthinus TaxID=670154 RepID=A0A1I6HMI8_9RHOB|nr:hypothetical protein SAMN04488002_3169 [Litoreibacter janthinus]
MFETCTMTQEQLASVDAGPLRLTVTGAPTLCVDPSAQFNPWPHAARLHVTNTSNRPVELTHHDGSVVDRAFDVTNVTEFNAKGKSAKSEPEDTTGPVDADAIKETSVKLAPGATYDLPNSQLYILPPMQAAVQGHALTSIVLTDEDRWSRRFVLEFTAWLKLDGKDITAKLNVPLTVVVKPPEP